MARHFLLFILIASTVSLAACGAGFKSFSSSSEGSELSARAKVCDSAAGQTKLSYLKEIRPLLEKNCLACHQGATPSGEFKLPVFANDLDARDPAHLSDWKRIRLVVASGQMPLVKSSSWSSDKSKLLSFIDGLFVDLPLVNRVPLRKLTSDEYLNSLRDALGVTPPSVTVDDLPQNRTSSNGFDNNPILNNVISETDALKYLNYAERAVTHALNNNAASLLACPGINATNVAECKKAVISRIGRRLFRRTLTTEELNGLINLSQEPDLSKSVGVALEGLISSPKFLYLPIELSNPDDPNSKEELSMVEMASQLSYFLWGSIPDEALLADAEAGQLSRERVKEHVRRMLKDSRSEHLIRSFARQWLALGVLDTHQPDPIKFPKVTPEVLKAMRIETESLIRHTISQDLNIKSLLTSDQSFLNDVLADYYGIPGVTGSSFSPVNTAAFGRRGLLSQGSILTLTSTTTETAPIRRGKFVLERITCTIPPPPSAEIRQIAEDQNLGALSFRDAMRIRASDSRCASCHTYLDPIGLGFEGFDPVGLPRAKYENMSPIDTSGSYPSGGYFRDAADLVGLIAVEPEFPKCMAEKLLEFAIARDIGPDDECRLYDIAARGAKNDQGFSGFIQEIVSHELFRSRTGGVK